MYCPTRNPFICPIYYRTTLSLKSLTNICTLLIQILSSCLLLSSPVHSISPTKMSSPPHPKYQITILSKRTWMQTNFITFYLMGYRKKNTPNFITLSILLNISIHPFPYLLNYLLYPRMSTPLHLSLSSSLSSS